MGRYDDMKADELRAEAEKRNLSTSGTKAELVKRLEDADTAAAGVGRAEAAQKTPGGRKLLDKDGRVDGPEVLAFTGDVRAAVAEIEERLAKEVVEPLDGLTAGAVDLGTGRQLGSVERVRGLVEDVRRALRGLSSSAATLGQDALG